jgi:transcriptional regulator with XRE-family HTH domain
MTKVNVELIKSLRKKQKLTLQDMANHLGYKSLWGYRHCESGDVDFKPEHLKMVADLFNVKLDSLFLSNELRKTQ